MAHVYAAHTDFVRPARSVTHPGNIVSVVATFLAAFFGFPILLMAFLPDAARTAFLEPISAAATLAQFGIFGVSAWALVWALRRVHGRGFWSLIGPYQAAWFAFRKTAISVGAILFLTQVMLPLGSWGPPALIRNPAVWAALVPLGVVAIMIQITTEEILFRGYLQQQLACLSHNPWVWMVIPSTLFGIWHFWNGNSPAEGFVYAFWATLLGLACADLTARTGNLGAALGVHFATNFTAVMFISTDSWPMSGLALILYPYEDPDVLSAEIEAVAGLWIGFSMAVMAPSVLIVWLAARISLKR